MKYLQLLIHLLTHASRTDFNAIRPLLALFLSCITLISFILSGIPVAYGLLAFWCIMAFAFSKSGYTFRQLLDMSKRGALTSIGVVEIFLLIGLITALWQASGTIPTLIAYSVELIVPNLFIASAFALTSLVSMLLGSSLGTVGTVGIVLIIIARAGQIPEDIVAGAVIAGAYVGDRNSPLSSSAALVATLTSTKVADNVPLLFKNSIPALLLSFLIYLGLSLLCPLESAESTLTAAIGETFVISPLQLLPAASVVLLLPFKVKIRYPFALSALTAFILAHLYQGYEFPDLVHIGIEGFTLPPDNPVAGIIKGGGILSMTTAAVVIMLACAIARMLEETGLWNRLHDYPDRLTTHSRLFGANVLTSLLTGGIGCSQSIATVMTHSILRIPYAKAKLKPHQIALDFENTGIVLSALIPWNIAAMVPNIMMGTSYAGYVPFAVYLYLLPGLYYLGLRYKERART